jgi:hypothetical protein
MNYAKVIGSALQLFPRKIKVTLIDATTGNKIGRHKIGAQFLPTAFNRPTIVEIENVNWRVLKADPIMADDFFYTKKLTLHVRSANETQVDSPLKYNLPTICNTLPGVGENNFNSAFILEMEADEWRQIEFLSVDQLEPTINALGTIEAILMGQGNPLLGYEQQYIRTSEHSFDLSISLNEFYSLFPGHEKGHIFLKGVGIARDGFAIRTSMYKYYGLISNGIIRTLGITEFESAEDEVMKIMTSFNLFLVDWCRTIRISAGVDETPKEDILNI